MSSSDDHDKNETYHAKEDLKQGLGLLFRAASKAATGLRKEIDRSGIGKSLDDAGRELARAASNVVGRIGAEIKKVPGVSDEPRKPSPPAPDDPGYKAPPPGWAPEPPGTKPKGPTPSDPGFRIAVDDDETPR
jgi:hypothetical protein